MKVDLSKQPITAEALETRLRHARQKAAAVHAYLTGAGSDLPKTYSGAELQIDFRELGALEHVLDMALRYAESLQTQVHKEVERIEEEDATIWGVSPEEFAQQTEGQSD